MLAHPQPMIILAWFLAAVVSVSSVARSAAQETTPSQLTDALRLKKEDRPRSVIALLEPLVKPGAPNLDAVDAGTIWELLGTSYQELEEWPEAVRCYDSAIRYLKSASFASGQAQYAATLDNLSSIEADMGQTAESMALSKKALGIYASLGCHGGVTVAATDLAMTAIRQNDFGSARRFFAKAQREAELSSLRLDDLAAISNVQGMLEEHDHQIHEAIARFDRAIALQSDAHGPHYFALAATYSLRAHAETEVRDFAAAIADEDQALSIIEASIGTNTPSYLRAQIVLARILRSSGKKAEANELENRASGSLTDLMRAKCSGCTVPVESLR